MAPTTLGTELARVRELRGRSLKSVSEQADMSTTYLQRLERDEIQSPSPHKLYALSEALEIPYVELMKLAGYVIPREGKRKSEAVSSGPLAFALSATELTEEEARDLAEYLAFLRGRKRSEGQG